MFGEYHPTGREHDIVRYLRHETECTVTVDELQSGIGANREVVERALENLTVLGCVEQVEPGAFELLSDPTTV